MDQAQINIKEQLREGLANYLIRKDENSLTAAYELGRSAANAGIAGIEMVNYYHEALLELNTSLSEEEMKTILESALEFLSECLVPYEIQQIGYQELIKKQDTQNQLLQEEITLRKASEEELRKSKEHFRHLIENALDIITVLDTKGYIRYESPSLKRILGYEPEELIGKNVFDFIHSDDLVKVKRKFTAVITSPGKTNSSEFRIKHKKGYWIYLESLARFITDAINGPALIINSRDVTEKVKAWEKIEQREKQLSTAQQIGRLGSWEWNIKKNTIDWSDEMCRIYGLNPQDNPRTYKEVWRYIHPEDRDKITNTIKKAINDKTDFRIDHRIIRFDGKEKILFVRGEVITDEKGEPDKMIGTGHDITELKETEKKLKKYSDKLRNLTARQEKVREEERMRLSRKLHDDLGQMLTVLRMEIFILIKETKKKYHDRFVSGFSEDIDKIINRIDTVVQSVQRLTTELRPEELDELGLEEALEWYAKEIGKQNNIKVKFTNNASAVNQFSKDQSTAIFRIFQEALENIVKHSQASTINILLDEENQYLILKIKDDGIGITQKQIDSSNSIGIIGMRERSLFLGGSLEFNGKPGKGTDVVLKVALNNKNSNSLE